MIKKRIRHIQRYRDIVYAFTKYGFGFAMKELGLLELLSIPKRIFVEGNQTLETKTTGERLRMFLEELGPTFIKMGQIASTRPDIFSPDVIYELTKLQDRVPLFSFEEVKAIVEQELGERLENNFAEFCAEPIAAASIGQVHSASLLSGEHVAVKIQRPNIRSIIETDLEILHDLARLAENRLAWAQRYQIVDVVEEFSKSLLEELDYKNEGRNSEKIAKQFTENPKIRIPKVYWDFTSSKVLTMEFLEGTKLNEVEQLQKEGFDCKALGERVVYAIFQQILMDGFFHGDPHPGNILALPGDVIAFMDFGIVGRITPDMRNHVASFVIALMRQNTDEVVKAISRMGLVPESVNRKQLRADVDQLREKYASIPFSEMSVGEAVTDLFSVAYRHRIQIPTDLTILGKTLLTIEGFVKKLDPELSIIKVAEPFGRKLLKERLHPKNMADRVWSHFNEYEEILDDLPKTVKDFTAVMKKGKMRIELTTPELDNFLKKVNKISNRLSLSLILLSLSILLVGLMIGGALAGHPSAVLARWPVMEIGFCVIAVIFLLLIFSILKSGRL